MANFGDGNDNSYACSFCGKKQGQVRKLVAGHNVFICDECIEVCNEMLAEEFSTQPQPLDGELPETSGN